MKKISQSLRKGKEGIFEQLETAVNSETEVFSWELSLDEFPVLDGTPMENVAKLEYLKPIFEVLNEITEHPCLYQFDLIDVDGRVSFQAKLPIIREQLLVDGFKMAPINKVEDSDVLYIGIRQPGKMVKKGLSKISSRILAHFGYYEKGAGVLLKRWPVSGLQFRLSIYKLDPNCGNFLELIEKIYAIDQKPMIGRH